MWRKRIVLEIVQKEVAMKPDLEFVSVHDP